MSIFFMVIFCIFSRGKSNKDMLSENDVFLQGVSYPPPLKPPLNWIWKKKVVACIMYVCMYNVCVRFKGKAYSQLYPK